LAEPVRIVADRLFEGGGAPPIEDACLAVSEGRIAGICPAADAPTPDYRFAVVAPGFVDLQINGGGGVLFNDAPTPDTLARMARAARQGGTAHLLPTFITAPGDAYAEALDAVAEAIAAGVPGIAGAHVEGPFLSRERPGIHPARHIRPLTEADAACLEAFPHPLVLTLAPEEAPSAMLDRLAAAGIRLFAGHTAARFEQIAENGALTGVTHLWNAMSQLGSRAPGVVGAALASDRLMAGVIADGHHVHPANLALAARVMGDRLFLVTDAMATLGSDIDAFDLFGVPVRLEGGRLISPEGTLAGAHLAMDTAVRRMVALGVAEAEALDMASGRPARAAGLAGLGRIAEGHRASLTCLSANLHAEAVMVDGAWAYLPETQGAP
jgi:N-acetylglucosamine-6-phosphate deacetylase